MKNSVTLYTCKNKLDAYFIKNSIQRVSCIAVDLKIEVGTIVLLVDDCNFDKSNTILMGQLPLLPSVVSKKKVVQENNSVEHQAELKTGLFSNGSLFYKNAFQALMMNFGFSA